MATPAPPQPAFTALFDDVSKDSFDGSYGPLFAPFDISLMDANATPNNVHQQIAAASNQRLPLAIALLVNGLIRVYCLPFRRNKTVGAAPVPTLDGKFFAFDGKFVLGQGVLVEIPAQWFNMTAQVQVPTLNNIWVQLAADTSPTLTLGPYAGGNPNTVAIKPGLPWSFPTSMSAYSWRSPMESLRIITLTPSSPPAGQWYRGSMCCPHQVLSNGHHSLRWGGVHPAGRSPYPTCT